jgi:hypothetical protein
MIVQILWAVVALCIMAALLLGLIILTGVEEPKPPRTRAEINHDVRGAARAFEDFGNAVRSYEEKHGPVDWTERQTYKPKMKWWVKPIAWMVDRGWLQVDDGDFYWNARPTWWRKVWR